jgi:RNA polymerase sigma-70 factor (ECF subfamily)
VQRALLQCYTAASSYQAQWAVSTWLYRILTNVCVDELRRRATRTAYGASIDVLDSTRPREPRRDLDLHRALARVPREARILLALRYAEGLSYEELAQVRGISVNTVKSQLARGKTLLREELGKRGILHD